MALGGMRLAAGTTIHAEALLFDMDGTLVDSTSVIAGLWRRWAARHGVDPDAVVLASPGRRAVETVRLFAPAGVDATAEAAFLARAAAEEMDGLVPVPGAARLLRALPRHRWAVVTSAERRLTERWLRHAGLPAPEVLVAAEDVGAGKPDPACYLQAAGRLGYAPDRTVVFEDAPSGLAAGRAAGARVIAIATTPALADLEAYDWLPDFSSVAFEARPEGSLRLKLHGARS